MPKAPAPDRERWGNPLSYKTAWAERARLAASLVPDGVTVLEIGVGLGAFGDLVKDRTSYVGADLEPLSAASMTLDLDSDPLPDKHFDYAVLLGVFSYLHHAEAAAKKLCDAADHIIASYCCKRTELEQHSMLESRRRLGWVNNFDQRKFVQMFSRHGHELISSQLYKATDEFEELVMEFQRSATSRGSR